MITKSHADRAISIYENSLVLQLALERFGQDATLEEVPQIRGMQRLLEAVIRDADYLNGDANVPDADDEHQPK
jgi:hypothetical protein